MSRKLSSVSYVALTIHNIAGGEQVSLLLGIAHVLSLYQKLRIKACRKVCIGRIVIITELKKAAVNWFGHDSEFLILRADANILWDVSKNKRRKIEANSSDIILKNRKVKRFQTDCHQRTSKSSLRSVFEKLSKYKQLKMEDGNKQQVDTRTLRIFMLWMELCVS